MTFGSFFLPGPTEVREEILAAMLQPMIPHRGKKFTAMFETIQMGLKDIFRTNRPVFVSTSSATGFMESAVRCAPEGSILSLVNGAFSERFAHIAEQCGRRVDRYSVEWGEIHSPDRLHELLSATEYSAITVVHSETSTGALNPIQALSDVAHAHGAICLVDSVSGMCGIEVQTDAWNLDFVLTGSQKAFALPPGLAFASASDAFVAQAAERTGKGVYFDITEFASHAAKQQVPNTPAISLFYALERQLRDIQIETMPARWDRHAQMRDVTHRWVAELQKDVHPDFEIVAQPEGRSATVTTIRLPAHITSESVLDAVAENGITVGSGYGKLKDTTIRIGHMGDHSVGGVSRCLDMCGDALRKQNRH